MWPQLPTLVQQHEPDHSRLRANPQHIEPQGGHFIRRLAADQTDAQLIEIEQVLRAFLREKLVQSTRAAGFHRNGRLINQRLTLSFINGHFRDLEQQLSRTNLNSVARNDRALSNLAIVQQRSVAAVRIRDNPASRLEADDGVRSRTQRIGQENLATVASSNARRLSGIQFVFLLRRDPLITVANAFIDLLPKPSVYRKHGFSAPQLQWQLRYATAGMPQKSKFVTVHDCRIPLELASHRCSVFRQVSAQVSLIRNMSAQQGLMRPAS